MDKRPIIIYGLTDPRDNEVRYVGKTNQKLSARLSAHINDTGKCHRVNWIRQLKRLGLRPKIIVIEEVGRWPWQATERHWIMAFRFAGVKLTNNTSGGDGVPDLPFETRRRIGKTWIGRKHKPETIEKLRICSSQHRHSKETKLKMSKAQKGRKILWTDKIAEANRRFDPALVIAIRWKLKNKEKVKDIAAELQVHRTTISKIKKGTYFDRYHKPK